LYTCNSGGFALASVLYNTFKQALLESTGPNLDTADIRLILVDTGAYTFSSAHDFLDDVPGGARIAVSGALQNTTTASGVFDADDITISAVSGATTEAVVIYCHDGGSDAARRLIAYVDSGTGINLTPNGSDVDVVFNSGASKIFAL
jgi:hypothetical protein